MMTTTIVQRDFSDQHYQTLQQAGYPAALARIFAARGIEHQQQLEHSLQQLTSFEHMKNAVQMAEILADIIAAGQKILVIADYDADGATACTIAVRGLRLFGAHIDFLVPNRFEYGYGLTPEIVELARSQQPDVLLTVDNGIASIDGVAHANQLGLQVLVTDHHLPGDELPEARCIVNPNQPGCPFPSKNLAGVGVMFYVLMALRATLRQRGAYQTRTEPRLGSLLDIVALGTVADVVVLDHNNRILVQQGLKRIRAGKACPGINSLLQVARKSPESVTCMDLGFAVGPRLNAAGRLDDMQIGIQCLLAPEPDQAMACAQQLDQLNRERRSIEDSMKKDAEQYMNEIDPADSFSLCLYNDSWHQGVIGILASRLKERYHRPTLVFAQADNGEIKGSGRSIPGLHLRDALDLVSKRHPGLIKKFGGHAAAAGLSLTEENFESFKTAFEQVARTLLTENDLMQRIETDGPLQLQDMQLTIAEQLNTHVWGQGFPAPLFHNRFHVVQQRIVGEKHLKLLLSPLESTMARPVDAILFGCIDTLPDEVDMVYVLDVNEFRGNRSLQLIIRHWQAAEALLT